MKRVLLVTSRLPAAETGALTEPWPPDFVPLTPATVDPAGDHERFCSGILWPVLHDLIGELPSHLIGFDRYQQINRRFAELLIARHRPGDVVWVHDYPLMLVPRLVRAAIPDARIGFFLHAPFPATDLFRVLPFGDQLLAGVLGADVLGFQTAAHLGHFAASVLRTLGAALDGDRIHWDGRTVRAGAFPMGVDAQELGRLASSAPVEQRVRELRAGQGQAHGTLLGIDRLDCTRGISRRLLAFRALLGQHPELRGRVKLVQVVLGSRTGADREREVRDEVQGLVGRINGEFGTAGWAPVHYISREDAAEDVVSLYRAADVLLVTPLRDGMNLVAKEFVACRTDGDGVLVLSQFAGAAAELADAVLVNPYDVDGMAQAFHAALVMPVAERRARMLALRQRVLACDVQRWSQLMLDALADGVACGARRGNGLVHLARATGQSARPDAG
jgi:trehalose 6-phosphate synthase/phosphatase